MASDEQLAGDVRPVSDSHSPPRHPQVAPDQQQTEDVDVRPVSDSQDPQQEPPDNPWREEPPDDPPMQEMLELRGFQQWREFVKLVAGAVEG